MKTVDPASVGMSAERLARIGEHLRRFYIEPGKIPGSVTLVARRGDTDQAVGMGALRPGARKTGIGQDLAQPHFGKDRIVGSLAHGVTANEGFMSDFASVMEMFLKTRNAAATAKAAQQIAQKNNIGK